MAWAEPLRAMNLPLISLGLVLTLLWRQRRAQSVKDRRQQAHVQKLQEQTSIRFLQQLFISMLVHEIKTPLTVVQLGASALVKKDIAPERKQAWDVRMHTAINSMVHILDNCSQADRYEGGVMAVSLSHILLTDTLGLVMGQAWVHSSAQSELLQLRIEKPIDDLRLHSDASYFQIILNNLLSNALKYSAQGSPVVLQVSQYTSGQGMPMVQLAVSNVKGPAGHPDPAKVFERYYRSPNASSISGTGLGLWLSQQLASRLGTKIQLSLEAEQVVFGSPCQSIALGRQMPDKQAMRMAPHHKFLPCRSPTSSS
ncbi:MAG: HAMP domain-containing histidine kinase [Rhodoferax sp.]|nr:HAMP domain-containing histidine kinase [Rhodoferax sp.]